MTRHIPELRGAFDAGHDLRRAALDPRDQARVWALAEQSGAIVAVSMLALGQMRVTWRDRHGHTIAVEGPSAAACVALIQQAIAADVIDTPIRGYQHGDLQ